MKTEIGGARAAPPFAEEFEPPSSGNTNRGYESVVRGDLPPGLPRIRTYGRRNPASELSD